ncbi:MAG: DUF2304 domain-containing protein [Myxococcales bacterium]|jgi:hypothetical protein
MNAFQYLVLLLLLVLGLQTLRGVLRGQMRKRIALFWLLIWSGAAVVVSAPRLTIVVARFVGIGRGADLVLYASVLLTLVGFFYIYTRFRRLDRQITLLVRRLAVENPSQPVAGPPDVSGEPGAPKMTGHQA